MTVFANGLEISAKAQGCKVIAAFPDPCFTPPQTPATPPGVPVPYPNFGQDSDLTSGSATVKIGGKEISLENSSKYSKCTGDEAGAAPKKGLVTSKNTGAVYAQKWSTDVKVEDKGVVRFTDLATSNHACNPGQPPPMVIVGKPGAPGGINKMECIVGEYSAERARCSAQTPPGQFHHIIPDRCFRSGRVKVPGRITPRDIRMDTGSGFPSKEKGICICLPPKNHCPSKSGDYSVHGDLDNKLTKLGYSPNRGSRNRGLAKLGKVRRQCFASLAKLVKKGVLDEDCYKLAVKEVQKATKDIGNADVRAEKSLSRISSSASTRMGNQ